MHVFIHIYTQARSSAHLFVHRHLNICFMCETSKRIYLTIDRSVLFTHDNILSAKLRAETKLKKKASITLPEVVKFKRYSPFTCDNY